MNTVRSANLVLFWLSFSAVVYTYTVYPVVLTFLAKVFGRRVEAPFLADADLPKVSVLIAAHNEEDVIEARITNALQLDYPREKLEVVIASDGSTDRTAELVRRHESSGVRLMEFTQNRGKASALNDAMAQIESPIVLMSDANTFTDPGAAKSLVRWFADPELGAVCGRLIITDARSGKNVDGVYWKYETYLKKLESRLGALLGSNGAIYAIRRQLYRPIPANTIVDDFVIPLLAKQRFGCRIIYDWQAVANEESAPDVSAEFKRRSRIGAGGFQAIGMLWRLLNPLKGWVSFTFFSHKVLRWLCPMFMIVALVCNAMALAMPAYRVLLAVQLCGYGAAVLGWLLPRSLPVSKMFRVASMFVSMNAALLVGFGKWLAGLQGGTWNRTRRLDVEGAAHG